MRGIAFDISFLICIFFTACGSVSELPQINYPKLYQLYSCNDGFSKDESVYYYTAKDIDSIVFNDTIGRPIRFYSSSLHFDSCHSALSLDHSALMKSAKFGRTEVNYMVYGEGKLMILAKGCQKDIELVREDSVNTPDFLLKLSIDSVDRKFIIQKSLDSFQYPFVRWSEKDNITIDLIDFCSQEELDEEKQSWQSMFEKNTEVLINPNPFIEEFTFQMYCPKIASFLRNTEIKLTFFDKNGNELKSQQIDPNKEYLIQLPQAPKGQTVIYTITWQEYKLSGNILCQY